MDFRAGPERSAVCVCLRGWPSFSALALAVEAGAVSPRGPIPYIRRRREAEPRTVLTSLYSDWVSGTSAQTFKP
jgi:hypothetical protein